jgi:hypothetical protein
MKTINGLCCQCLSYIVVAARPQVDVLLIPGLFLVESLFEEKLNHILKIHLSRAILLEGFHRQINWLQEVIVDNLLSDHLVLASKHIIELLKGMSPVEMDFLGPLVEIGDGFVDSELNTKFATVDVDLRI